MADDRTYIRVHDGMPGHPKIRGLSDKAFRTLIRAWCYCSEYLTDGEVIAAVARDLGPKRTWDELIAAGIVESAPNGYLMHDYLEHQRSADEVREIKAARGAGGQFGNHIRWHVKRRKPDPECEFCIANRSQDRSVDRSQNDRSPIANGSHSHKQSQIHTSPTYVEEGGYVPNAPAKPPLYSDRCTSHGDVLEPGPCGACADVRKSAAHPRPLTLVAAQTQRCLVHFEEDVNHCRGCAADRKAAESA